MAEGEGTAPFDPADRSKTLQKLLPTLTPDRERYLREIGSCPDKPEMTKVCCGSSCDPCVKVLYGQELRIWKECWKYEPDPVNEEPAKIVIQVNEPKKLAEEAEEKPKTVIQEVVRLWSW